MASTKINLLILPLLIAILLSVFSKLRIGKDVDHIAFVILSPIQYPVSSLRSYFQTETNLIKNLPQIYKQNIDLKNTNSGLLTENQNLKNLIQDKSALAKIGSAYKTAIPIRIVNTGNTISATSALDISSVVLGQPVVIGTTLVGVVSDVKKPVISFIPLSNEQIPQLTVKTGLGQNGIYQYSARTPQIVNIPSENPVSLNDVVFTQAQSKIPANLVIGKITKILSSSESPLQKAEIKLDIDPSQYDNLAVITEL